MANIQVGDTVVIRHHPRARSDDNRTYEVVTVKTSNPAGSPFWELSRNNDIHVYDTPIILIKHEVVD